MEKKEKRKEKLLKLIMQLLVPVVCEKNEMNTRRIKAENQQCLD